VAVLALGEILLVGGCADASSDSVTVRGIDEVQVATPEQLAAGARDNTGRLPGEGGEGTIPLAEEEGSFGSSLGSALEKFNTCTERLGWEFVGFPDPDSADPVIGDPAYAEAMGTCANESRILEVFDEQQERMANMTPDEVEEFNTGIVALRECLLRRGWEWGELEPDENGVLGNGLPSYPGVENPLDTLDDPNARRDLDECGASQFGF
jgi:hypothetical protein